MNWQAISPTPRSPLFPDPAALPAHTRPALRRVSTGVGRVAPAGWPLGPAADELAVDNPCPSQSSDDAVALSARGMAWHLPDDETCGAHLWSNRNSAAVCGRRASSWRRLDRRSRSARQVTLCVECAATMPQAPGPHPARPAPAVPAAQSAAWTSYLARLGATTEFSAETRRAYASRVTQYLRWLDAREPSTDALREFCAELQAQGRAGRTVNAYLTAIANFHRFSGPEVERPAPLADPGTVPAVLRPAEVARLSATIAVWSSPRDQAILRLLLGVALRTGELTALDCGNVTATPTGVRLALPAGRNHPRRTFDLPAEEFRHLVQACSGVYTPDVPLFMNNQGQRLSARAIAMLVDRAGVASGLVGLNPRTLRQTAITDRLTAERDAEFDLVANVGADRRAVMINEIDAALRAHTARSLAGLRAITEKSGALGREISIKAARVRRQAAELLAGLQVDPGRPQINRLERNPYEPGPADAGLAGWGPAEWDLAKREQQHIGRGSQEKSLDTVLIDLIEPALPIESTPQYVERLERFVRHHRPELDVIYRRIYRRPGPAVLSHEPIALVVFERLEADHRLLREVWRRQLPVEDLDDLTAIWRRARRLRHRAMR